MHIELIRSNWFFFIIILLFLLRFGIHLWLIRVSLVFKQMKNNKKSVYERHRTCNVNCELNLKQQNIQKYYFNCNLQMQSTEPIVHQAHSLMFESSFVLSAPISFCASEFASHLIFHLLLSLSHAKDPRNTKTQLIQATANS